MGRKAISTEEEVFRAADQLIMQGQEVTASALLKILGGGSLTTIYKHLEAWRAARPADATVPALVEVPDNVQAAFNAAWRVAAGESAKEVGIVKERAAEEVRAARKEFDEAREQIKRLEAEAEAEAANTEALAQKVSELEQALSAAHSEAAGLRATVEEQNKRVEAAAAEVNRLRAEAQGWQKERDEAIKEAAELNGRVKTLTDQNAEILSRIEGKHK